jgi:NADH:ubiquinone oxidoreductase subunit 6 (subunit J)
MENSEQSPSTLKIGVTYGLFAGLFSIIVFIIVAFLGLNPFGNGLNYIGTVASIVLLVLAHKKFKQSGDGFMTYGQGLGISVIFFLVSSFLSLAVMYIYINFVDYAPMQAMLDEQLQQLQKANTPDDSIEMAQKITKDWFWVFGAFGALLVGLIVGLIVSIFTQKKNPEPFA